MYTSSLESYVYLNSTQRQTGVGMVEVLITLFILSVGLLGVASLQFMGSLSNSDALNRTQAVLVAQQFSERLRVNAAPNAQSDGFVVDNAYFDSSNYNFETLTCSGSGLPHECYCRVHPAAIPNCQTGECDAQEFAQFDAYQMSCAAVKGNPNVTLALTCTDNNLADTDQCSAGSIHNVVITWPIQSIQNNAQQLNPACNVVAADSNACVVVELAL